MITTTTCLFADDDDQVEREKVKAQEREGLNQRRETPEKVGGDGMDPKPKWRSQPLGEAGTFHSSAPALSVKGGKDIIRECQVGCQMCL